MRIGIDATSWTNRRGFGRFTRNAVSRLVALDADASYVLVIDGDSADAAGLPSGVEITRVTLDHPPGEAAAAGSNRSVRDMLRLIRAVRRERLSAFLFPSLYTYFPVPGVPTVVGVHDTIADEHPELTFPARRSRILWSLKQRIAMQTATRIFTVSEASRKALLARSPALGDRLVVVPEAPDPVFTVRGESDIAEELVRLGIQPDAGFFLYSGGISPHKNIETLLDAYAALRARRMDAPALVLVGDLDRETYVSAAADVRRRIDELGVRQHVVLPGFVSDTTLACLYSRATAVVLPSLAEGFGLPAVEAAACGAPVILSDLPAHRESLADGGLYFSPRDTVALTAALTLMLDDPQARASLAARAHAAVADMSWDGAATTLRELLAEVARP